MTPGEFVSSIAGFVGMRPVDQIKRFCWFVARHEKRATFTAADIASCYELSKCPKPSSISPFCSSLANQKPPYLIRRGSEFELSRLAHEQFDALLGQRDATIVVQQVLQDLPSKLAVPVEKAYLDEALRCFRHDAVRAAIVMTWNLAYAHLCNVILTHHISSFNAQLPLSFPKADIRAVVIRDDFEALKESQVLQVAKSANIISGSVHKILKEKLDRRNIAAHPSNVVIRTETAEEFILDLVQNVVLKL